MLERIRHQPPPPSPVRLAVNVAAGPETPGFVFLAPGCRPAARFRAWQSEPWWQRSCVRGRGLARVTCSTARVGFVCSLCPLTTMQLPLCLAAGRLQETSPPPLSLPEHLYCGSLLSFKVPVDPTVNVFSYPGMFAKALPRRLTLAEFCLRLLLLDLCPLGPSRSLNRVKLEKLVQ